MTRLIHLSVLVFFVLGHNVLGDLEPAPGVPAFIRSAVEQRPQVSYRPTSPFFMKQSYVFKGEFGSMSLPLRSAVESIPSVPEFERIPLRDAVEYRPIEDERRTRSVRSANFGFRHTNGKYDAFLIPSQHQFLDPQPFRIGSPYQQLVDISAEPDILLNQHQIYDVYQLTSSALRNPGPQTMLADLRQGEEKYVFCYFTNWAFYRKGEGQFVPENIDPSLCTHIIYSFSSLDAETLLMKEFDPFADFDNDLYKRATKMNVPVLLAIGGWTDSTGDKYSRMVRDPSSRTQFIQNAVSFLKRYNFYGLSFEWNYPKCWQSDCRKGPADDKANFAAFIAEMRRTFKSNGLMLGVALSGYIEVIRQAYDLRGISSNVDFMNVMAYDYHGAWEGKTGHISPLYYRDGDMYPQYNVDYAIQELIKLGAAREKLILGIPFYGQTFLLKELGQNNQLVGEGAESYGPGNAGEFTKQPGMWSYYEICHKIKNERFNVGRDPNHKSGAFASNYNQWVGFDDAAAIELKMKYLLDNGLGGAAAWTIDLDDFSNRCCESAFPLLKAINRGLGKYARPATTSDCARPAAPVTPPPAVMTTVGENGLSDVQHQHTTWPSWNPATTAQAMVTHHPTTTTTTTRRPTTTTARPTTTRPPTTTTRPPTTTTRAPTTTTRRSTVPVSTTTSPWWTPAESSTQTWWSQSTTQHTTVPVPGLVQPVYLDEQCEGNAYKPAPNNCNQYYRCIDGTYTLQSCVAGLHWHQAGTLCDWPANAKCQSTSVQSDPPTTTRRPATTTTPRPTTARPTTARPTTTTSRRPTVTTSQRPPMSPVLLDSHCSGNAYLPDASNCNQYYRCIDNRYTLQKCAPALHWNNNGLICDWPLNSGCTGGGSLNDQAPTTTTSRTTPARLTTTTPRRPISTTTRRTTQKVTTTTKRTTVTRKPDQKPTTVTAHFTTTINYQDVVQTTSKRPTSTPSEPCQSYTPAKDCASYIICINNKRVKQDCPPGLQFSAVDKICDRPENVNCVTKHKYAKLANLKVSQDEKCEEGHSAIDPSDCTKYFLCVHSLYYGQECPNDLHYNAQTHGCDWPSNANCKATAQADQVNLVHRPVSATPAAPEKEIETDQKGEDYNPSDLIKVPEDNNLQPLSGHYKVVCYFTNWAWYRKGAGKYLPDDINTDLCTHIVYGFAVLDYSELIIRTHDSWADIDNKFYERVSGLKSKGIKVSLALGGWNDSMGDKYSRLVRSAEARRRFVNQALEFCERFGFEGLDLDWEYPVCWQVDCKKGFADEKEGFASLVRELHAAFAPKGLLLSAAVSPSKMVIDAGYDVPTLAKYLDWIAVMTYDYHGQWDKKTGHVAPLYYHPEDEVDNFNANFSMHYWMEKGAPASKLVMGMPLYGQSFQLADPKRNGLNAKAPGPGEAGEFTRAAGFLAYYEICDRIKNRGWKIVRDPLGRMGPFAYKNNQWVSYDDQPTLKRKTQLIKSMNLAGGMIWALDLDDFKNRCEEGSHPLLKVIREELRAPPDGAVSAPATISEAEVTSKPEPMKPATTSAPMAPPQPLPQTPEEEIPDMPVMPAVSNEIDHQNENIVLEEMNGDVEVFGELGGDEEEEDDEDDYNELGSRTDFKVVCYFTNWAWYRQSGGKFLPEDIDPDLCTHIVYGFAVLDGTTLTMKPHDSWADIDNKFYDRVVSFRKKGIKVTVAIGGWNDSAGDKYSRLVLNDAARRRFAEHVTEFIEKYGFDGLDLDWEYPVCWQVDCTKGSPEEKEGFSELVKELSRVFKPKGLLLSTAVSPSKKVIDAGYDVPTLSRYFDWIAVMTYDYHGQWDKQTGHVAPMYEHPLDVEPTFNANFSINYWLEKGADRQKIVMGMPMYGQSFSLADNSKHGLNSMTYGGGEAGDATRARGFLSYYEICMNIKNKGWRVVRDRKGRMGPYAYLRDQWVSFDDIAMIRHKSQYVRAMELGGAMIWALDLDDFRNVCGCEEYPLLRTINRELRGYPRVDPKCVLETETEYVEEESSRRPEVDTRPQDDHHQDHKPATPEKKPETTTTTRRPTTTTTTTTEAAVLWEEGPGSQEGASMSGQACSMNVMFVNHNTDCEKYYMCNHNKLMELRCPAGTYWNNGHCGWDRSSCSSKPQQMQDEQSPAKPKPTTARPHKTTASPSKRPKPTKPNDIATFDDQPEKPTPPHAPDSQPPVVIDSKYKVVCYFTNWAWYRPGEGKYTPDDIDGNLCTHIVYGFAVLNRDTLTLKTHDSWADIDNRFYERVVEYKKKGIKVTLAIGGWNDSLGDKYSRLVLSASARARFVTDAVQFLEKYGFEGLDLDWEYPVCWQVECDKGDPEEKEGFAALVRELSAEFKPRGMLLSAAVSPSKMVIDKGYDVPTLAKYFDWIAVMTYDFHGHWDKQTGHVAPLYHYPGDKYDYFNANFSINYWMEKGAPASKLVMGMPLYGQSFSLADNTKTGLNSKSYGPGEAGEFTRAGGFLAFYEICDRINKGGWTVERDVEGRIGPYAHRGSQWVSYDDVAEIRRKSDLVKQWNLGGGMVWALDLDDFRGRCGCGNHPLLTTLNQELRGVGGRRLDNCT